MPLLPWAARSLAYGLGLPHAGGGPADYRTEYSNNFLSLTQVLFTFPLEFTSLQQSNPNTYLTSRMYNGIVYGPPTDAHRGYHVEDNTRAR
jgi:hypothetical protein